MARLRFSTRNLISQATLSLSGFTAQAIYPLANLLELSPVNPFKANEQTGRILLDFGSATTVRCVALVHPNLDAGLSVKWQGHASNPTGSTLDAAFTIGAQDAERYRPNSYLDLSASPPSFRYYNLYVEGTNSLDVILGNLWVGADLETLTHNYSDGFRRADVRPGRKNWPTQAGVRWTYPSIGRQRSLSGEVESTDVGIAAISAWSQAAGGQDQVSLIIPDAPDITDAVMGHALFDFEYGHIPVGSGRVPFGFLEAARGTPWP